MKKYIAILVGVIALAPLEAQPLTGQVVITEIMYDLAGGSDSGREWIEVFNAGSAGVTLRNYKLVENGSNHKITGSGVLAPGAYAVIADNPAKFKTDYPAHAGFVFDSAFSLNNEGESIAIVDGSGSTVDAVSYTQAGGNGSGDSLQRNPSGVQFAAGIPTPGVGIPASGLTKSPPKKGKSAKKTAAKNSAPTPLPEIIGEPASLPTEVTFTAAAASAAPSSLSWLFPLLLAVLGSAGVVTARHYRKSEWDIVEEVEETG